VLLDLYIFIFGGFGLLYMCGLVVDWVRLCFWGSVSTCVYVCRFSALVYFVLLCVLCIFVIVVTPRLPIRTL